MLQSTIEAILAQLPGLCDKLKIADNHRNGFFMPSREGQGPLEILVDVGEVHMGTGYRFTFDAHGALVGASKEIWDYDSDPRFLPVDMVIFTMLTGENTLCCADRFYLGQCGCSPSDSPTFNPKGFTKPSVSECPHCGLHRSHASQHGQHKC